MFRLRTKEIGFGSGKNESCRLVALFCFTSSELGNHVQAFVSTELLHLKVPYEP
ncbi:hypothetical protein F383_20892 [Gossypium arboreum]|uniref:Uncharacterized protein n=1 Tax=Gossypium arboreum TaxID=29729 RepID=A0A0B0NTD5_GOSAR|nr:hypothetical protein F383_20892 [Gossypium arboreum]